MANGSSIVYSGRIATAEGVLQVSVNRVDDLLQVVLIRRLTGITSAEFSVPLALF